MFSLELPVQAPLLPDLVDQTRDLIDIIKVVPIPPPRPPPPHISYSPHTHEVVNGVGSPPNHRNPRQAEATHLNAPIASHASHPSTYYNVRASFDRHIMRKLHSFMPLRALSPPSHPEAWAALQGMLDGWHELARMVKCDCLMSWVVGLDRIHISVDR